MTFRNSAVKNYLESWNMAVPPSLLQVLGKQLNSVVISQRNVNVRL